MRKLRLTAALAPVLGGALVATASLAAADPAQATSGANTAGAHASSTTRVLALSGEYHRIQNVVNGLCLQPQDSPGTRIVQVVCNGSNEQGWMPLNDGNNRYRFVNGSARGCMSVLDRPSNGAAVFLGNCTLSGGTGQSVSNATWLSNRILPDSVTLRTRVGNVDNNFCLDEPGGSSAVGLAMQLFTCNGSGAQQWLAGFN